MHDQVTIDFSSAAEKAVADLILVRSMRFVVVFAMIVIGLNGCAHANQSTNAGLVRAAARDWLAHHPEFVARNGDYVSGVAMLPDPDHAQVPVRSAFAHEVTAVLRLERIDGSWQVISTQKPSAMHPTRLNHAMQPTASPRTVSLSDD